MAIGARACTLMDPILSPTMASVLTDSNGLGFTFKGTSNHLESLPITPCEADSQANIHCPAHVDVSFDGSDFNLLEGEGSGTHIGFNPKFFNRVLEAKRITFRYTNKGGQNRTVTFHVAGFPADKRKELQRKRLIE